MNAELIPAAKRYETTAACVYTAQEAATRLGVSQATIRRTTRALGVKRIAGPVVAGFVRFTASPVDVVLPYSA